jgi:hypothetical protein
MGQYCPGRISNDRFYSIILWIKQGVFTLPFWLHINTKGKYISVLGAILKNHRKH